MNREQQTDNSRVVVHVEHLRKQGIVAQGDAIRNGVVDRLLQRAIGNCRKVAFGKVANGPTFQIQIGLDEVGNPGKWRDVRCNGSHRTEEERNGKDREYGMSACAHS